LSTEFLHDVRLQNLDRGHQSGQSRYNQALERWREIISN